MFDDDHIDSSPFGHHLATNYAPSERELVQIDFLLESPREKLMDLRSRAKAAQTILDNLLQQQTSLERFITAHEALASPIRRIPREILQEIFLHCLPLDRLPILSLQEAPLLLTRICRPWRDLAHSTPSLWSALRIVAPSGHKDHRNFQRKRIERWLSYTKSVPLTLEIWSLDPPDLTISSEFDEAFCTAIHPHAHHIHSLSLDVSDQFLKAFADNTSVSWPLLHKVSIIRAVNWDQHPAYKPIEVPFLHIWGAPNITKVAWNSVFDAFMYLCLDWGQLEEVEIWDEPSGYSVEDPYPSPFCELSARDARRILNAAPSLQKLRLRIASHDDSSDLGPDCFLDPEPDPSEVLVMENLTSLHLWDSYLDPDSSPTVFLENLQLPVLEHLTYMLWNNNEGEASSAPQPSADNPFLLRFLRAQEEYVGIAKLTINATIISRRGFLACLRLMPELEQLWLKDKSERDGYDEPGRDDVLADEERLNREVVADDDFLRSFLVEGKTDQECGEDDVLCPHLHSMRVDDSQFSFEAVQKFVESRFNAAQADLCAFIRRISIDFPIDRPTFVPNEAKRLAMCPLEEDLRGLGVDVTVRLRNETGFAGRSWADRKVKDAAYNPRVGLPTFLDQKIMQRNEPWL